MFIMIIFLNGCSNSEERGFQGYIEGENIYLASPNSGVLKLLAVKRGQFVRRGQLLFELDKDPQALLVSQYEADLIQANHILKDLKNPSRKPQIEAIKAQIEEVKARIDLAQIRVQRYQSLFTKKAIDKDSLDASLASLKEQQYLKNQYENNLQLALLGSREEQVAAQEAQILSLNAKLREIQWQLKQKKMYAPANGIIFDTYYRLGEFVGSQQAVLSLLTPSNIQVEFFIPIDALKNTFIGQKIWFKCDTCVKKSRATIAYISPEAEYIPPLVYGIENSDKLVFRIKADIIDFNEYKPGQPVMVYGIKS